MHTQGSTIDARKLVDREVITAFGKNIAECLALTGGTIEGLAIRTEIDASILRGYELGERRLTIECIEAVCHEFGVPQLVLLAHYGSAENRKKVLEDHLRRSGRLPEVSTPEKTDNHQSTDSKDIVWNDTDLFGIAENGRMFNLKDIAIRKGLIANIRSLFRKATINSFTLLNQRSRINKPDTWWASIDQPGPRIYGTQIEQISEAFGVSVYALLTGEDLVLPTPLIMEASAQQPQSVDMPASRPQVKQSMEEVMLQEIRSNQTAENELVWSKDDLVATTARGESFDLGNKNMRTKVARIIRAHLKTHATIRTFADLTRSSQAMKQPSSWLPNLENAIVRVYGVQIKAMAKAFGVSPYDFLTESARPLMTEPATEVLPVPPEIIETPVESKAETELQAEILEPPDPAVVIPTECLAPAQDMQEYFRLQVLSETTELAEGVRIGQLLVLAREQANVDWVAAYLELTKEGSDLSKLLQSLRSIILSHAHDNQIIYDQFLLAKITEIVTTPTLL